MNQDPNRCYIGVKKTNSKAKHATLEVALAVAASMIEKRPETKAGLRAYFHDACMSWHLGHKKPGRSKVTYYWEGTSIPMSHKSYLLVQRAFTRDKENRKSTETSPVRLPGTSR